MTIVSELDHCTLNLLSSDDCYYKAAFLGYAVAFSERKILNTTQIRNIFDDEVKNSYQI